MEMSFLTVVTCHRGLRSTFRTAYGFNSIRRMVLSYSAASTGALAPPPLRAKEQDMTTHSANDLRPIRSPRGIPFLGNTPQIPDTNPFGYFAELSKQFPEGIYGMDIAGI